MPIIFYSIEKVYIYTLNHLYRLSFDVREDDKISKIGFFMDKHHVLIYEIHSFLILLIVITAVPLIVKQQIYLCLLPILCLLIYGISLPFYASKYGYEFVNYFTDPCVKSQPVDYVGMITCLSHIAYKISMVPFLIIYKFHILAFYYFG